MAKEQIQIQCTHFRHWGVLSQISQKLILTDKTRYTTFTVGCAFFTAVITKTALNKWYLIYEFQIGNSFIFPTSESGFLPSIKASFSFVTVSFCPSRLTHRWLWKVRDNRSTKDLIHPSLFCDVDSWNGVIPLRPTFLVKPLSFQECFVDRLLIFANELPSLISRFQSDC